MNTCCNLDSNPGKVSPESEEDVSIEKKNVSYKKCNLLNSIREWFLSQNILFFFLLINGSI